MVGWHSQTHPEGCTKLTTKHKGSWICLSTGRLGFLTLAPTITILLIIKRMDIMLQSLSNLARSQDLYFFRSTSPGHHDCCCNKRFNWTLGTRITPLKSYSEYSIPHDHKYDWDKFEHYNAYTQLHLLHGSKNFDVLVSRAPIFFLNIFNMTVLRHDGHGPGDCLHYLPAVTDWWNHLLFTYLQELSRVEMSSWSNCPMN